MKLNGWTKWALLGVSGAWLFTGCVTREEVRYQNGPPGETVVSDAPPPAIVESQPLPPDPTYVWIGGEYVWRGGVWVWAPGRWAHPPRPGVVWVPHRYVYRHGRHVYVGGYWR